MSLRRDIADARLHAELMGKALNRMQAHVDSPTRLRIVLLAAILSVVHDNLDDFVAAPPPRPDEPDPLAAKALKDPHIQRLIGGARSVT